jgi:uncharacterized protein YndB with AHSA1/START domain
MTALRKTESAETELVITRIFEAPRELVWKCWTEPEHLKQWGAPHGFTVTLAEGELKVGGRWRGTMRAAVGSEHTNGGVYREIVPPERLVYTFAWEDEHGRPGHETLLTIKFQDLGGRTRMIFRQTGFESVSSRDGHGGGWNESFERLGDYVAQLERGETP